MAAPLLALILSVIGLLKKQEKAVALVGLVISGILAVLFFVLPFLARCLL